MRRVRGFFQNFFTCNSGSTRFSNASYTLGYLKRLVSWVKSPSSNASYSTFDFRIARSKSVPRSSPFARKCSFTRVEKNRARDSSKQIPVRSSISMRISLNSCSLRPCAGPCRSLITVPLLLRHFARAENHCLPQSAGWDGPLGIFQNIAGLRRRAELRQSFVQLIGKFHKLAYGCDCSSRTL